MTLPLEVCRKKGIEFTISVITGVVDKVNDLEVTTYNIYTFNVHTYIHTYTHLILTYIQIYMYACMYVCTLYLHTYLGTYHIEGIFRG